MIDDVSYKNALIAAITLHVLIAVMLFWESTSHEPPVLTVTAKQAESNPLPPQQQAIKAVSIDSQEVMNTVTQLKQERLEKQQEEQKRQSNLTKQAEQARKQRIAEQQRLEKLKSETAKLAIAHKKQMEDEKKHLKELTDQKLAEEKHLADMKKQNEAMKKQQQKEVEHLAALEKQAVLKKQAELKKQKEKPADDDHKEQALLAEKKKQAKIDAQLQKNKEAAAAQAAVDSQNSAMMSGEVDKYKALIIGAISRQWILPDNADSKLSSQFRIRLAPDGAVLDVSLIRSSGDSVLDRSAQSAIYKASPLPVPVDPEAFNVFRDISLTVRPENSRG